jgi:hypothetical protein
MKENGKDIFLKIRVGVKGLFTFEVGVVYGSNVWGVVFKTR